jgi:ABC-type Fe3+ transport system permease subunit
LSFPAVWLLLLDRRPALWQAGEPAIINGAALSASVAVAVCATLLSLAQGTLLAAFVVLTRLPGRQILAALWLIPFVAPATVWALCGMYCYGPGGIVDRCLGSSWRSVPGAIDGGHYIGTTIVLSQIYTPLAMVLIGRGMARLGHAGFDAARLYFSAPARITWMLRSLAPEIIAAALLTFALAIGNFAVPNVLQCRLYPTYVYLRMSNYLDQAGAARAAAPLVSIALAATTAFVIQERRRRYVDGHVARTSLARAPRPLTWVFGGFLLIYSSLAILLPIGALVYECSSFSRFVAAVQEALPETFNTLCLAVAATLAACGLGLTCGAYYARPRFLPLTLLTMAPAAFPALVIGLAYARFFHYQDWVDAAWLGDSGILLVLALAYHALPFGAHIVANGYARMSPNWREAAQLSGMNRWQQTRWIVGPLMAPHLAAAAVIASALSMADVEISQLLCAPGSGTLALRLLTFLHFGPPYVTASLALLQLVLAVVPAFIYFLLTNRRLEPL